MATGAWAPPATGKRVCGRCLFDEDIPFIKFDEGGVCNYCSMVDRLEGEYPAGEEGARRLEATAAEIREAGRKKPYDVIVGVSGGTDSSLLIHKAKELGLRPLAVHFDNTWDSTVAVENIHRVLKKLDVELFTYVVDNEEYHDIQRAFMLAGVPDIEAPTDIGLATTMYMAAEKFGIRYIMQGHSFRTEGVFPLGWLYMDGKYIQSVHRAYGEGKIRTFPNLWLRSFLKWTVLKPMKIVRPLYHVDFNKEEAKRFLADEFGWQWYGGHHLENRFTAFYHSYFLPRRYGIDSRVSGHAALVRSGQMTREEGLRQLSTPPQCEPEIVEMVKKRLGFSDTEFERVMNLPKKTYRDFKTYKPTFERLRPFFWLLSKMNRVPRTFYLRYTSKTNMA